METIEIKFQLNAYRDRLGWLGTQTYTIAIGNHRIVTVFTANAATAKEWFSQILKNPPPSSCNNYSIVVGFTAETQTVYRPTSDSPYDYFSICVGNQCLLYSPESACYSNSNSRGVCIIRSFFSDPRVVVVGKDMDRVAKKLERDLDIKFYNSFDVNKLASLTYPPPQVEDEDEDEAEGKDRIIMPYKNYSLDDLTKVVFNKQVPRIIGGDIHCTLVRRDGTSTNIDYVSNKSYDDITSPQFCVISTLDACLLYGLGDKFLCRFAEFNPYSAISKSKRKKLNKKKKIKMKHKRNFGIEL